jgi:shikimate dehydrogenase
MKKYFVIGNPINHSLSPKLHNYWIKKNSINAIYEKKKLNLDDLKNLVLNIKKKEINGINVTVPFKKEIIPYLDKLSPEAQSTQSVNTISLNNDEIIGYNTDIDGFEFGIKDLGISLKNKQIFILGAGGVVPSIIFALYKMKVSKITVCNRTKNKAENLKKLFNNIKISEWGNVPNFDMIINATSVGLNRTEKLNLDLSNVGQNKIFYDVIYNPSETNFLETARKKGNMAENGKKMFIYQARAAFKLWHGIEPEVNTELEKLLEK